MLHEGGHVIQKVDGDARRFTEQFTDQQHASELAMFEIEKQLRNDQASFGEVRALSPTRYRFRIVDANGHDIRYGQSAVENAINDNFQCSVTASEDTRVSCAEPAPGVYSYQVGGFQKLFMGSRQAAQLTTTEQPGRYRANVAYH